MNELFFIYLKNIVIITSLFVKFGNHLWYGKPAMETTNFRRDTAESNRTEAESN